MYELIKIALNTFVINCPAKMGMYRVNDKDVWLIDSGNDKDAGRKVQKILEAQGFTLLGILNTHSNADHVGGNQLLQTRLNVPVFSTAIENAFIANPYLEPSFLYGGYPPKQLRNKFLLAPASTPWDISQAKLPDGMEIFPLAGHFFDMIGVKTPDNVYFVADSVFGEPIIEKYHISFVYDVDAFLKTLDYLKTLQGSVFVPAHADITEDIHPLVDINRKKVLEILDILIDICQTPLNFEEILKRVFEKYSLTMDMNQYVLVGSTIRSYLSYLADNLKIEINIIDNKVLWHSK